MSFYHGIGFAKDGGFVLAKDFESQFHQDEYIVFVLSLSDILTIVDGEGSSKRYACALIPRHTRYGMHSGGEGLTVIVHLEPLTTHGMLRATDPAGIKQLDQSRFVHLARAIEDWIHDNETTADQVLEMLLAELLKDDLEIVPVDTRVLRCAEFVRQADIAEVNLSNAAKAAALSKSRLSHLFRKETGSTFRDFVLHQKLVRSLRSIHDRSTFIEASFSGGFADQPHFTNAFKDGFGIAPSSIKG